MVSFQGTQKLNSYLVRAKIYPLEHNIGSCHCGKKHCQVSLNVTETNAFITMYTSSKHLNGQPCFQEHIFEHFISDGHVTFILYLLFLHYWVFFITLFIALCTTCLFNGCFLLPLLQVFCFT